MITVVKNVWLHLGNNTYDEYVLTYVATKKVKKNLYWFELKKVEKISKKPFGGEGGYIVKSLPYYYDKKLLRLHKISWNVKNFTWAGRVKRWFNVHHPCKDDDYMSSPAELYPIYRRDDNPYCLIYPKDDYKY